MHSVSNIGFGAMYLCKHIPLVIMNGLWTGKLKYFLIVGNRMRLVYYDLVSMDSERCFDFKESQQ